MSKSKKTKTNITIKATIEWYPYDTKKKNKEVVQQIKEYIKDTLYSECSYIPFYIEEQDTLEEGCTHKSTFKVKTNTTPKHKKIKQVGIPKQCLINKT